MTLAGNRRRPTHHSARILPLWTSAQVEVIELAAGREPMDYSVEARIARLESDVAHLRTDVAGYPSVRWRNGSQRVFRQTVRAMKVRYFADTDSLFIEFRDAPSAETRDLDENTIHRQLGG